MRRSRKHTLIDDRYLLEIVSQQKVDKLSSASNKPRVPRAECAQQFFISLVCLAFYQLQGLSGAGGVGLTPDNHDHPFKQM